MHTKQVFLENIVVPGGSDMNLQCVCRCHSARQEAFGRLLSSFAFLERHCHLSGLHSAMDYQLHGTMYRAQTQLKLCTTSFSTSAQLYLALTRPRVQQDPKYSHAPVV